MLTLPECRIRIGGIQRASLVDYPGQLAAVVFTAGCPWACGYCHNPSLSQANENSTTVPLEEVCTFLEDRAGKLNAFVLSGGEPTLWPEAIELIRFAKELGYLVKVDSSGVCPEILENWIQSECIDYLAMDVKAGSHDRYRNLVQKPVNWDKLTQSIDLILHSGIAHEFRTTVIPGFHTEIEIMEIAKLTEGAQLHALQAFRPGTCLDENYNGFPETTRQHLMYYCNFFKKLGTPSVIRA